MTLDDRVGLLVAPTTDACKHGVGGRPRTMFRLRVATAGIWMEDH